MVGPCQASYYYVPSTFHMQSASSILQSLVFIAEKLVSLHHAQLGADFADPLKFQACLATIGFADYSLCIKAGVHFTLCGGTIAKLGTEKHHTKLLPLLDDLTLPGCFGMTELGHGSNVMGIQTQVLCAACMCVSYRIKEPATIYEAQHCTLCTFVHLHASQCYFNITGSLQHVSCEICACLTAPTTSPVIASKTASKAFE